MDFVIIFAVGLVLGFVAAWILMRATTRPNREIVEQYGALGEQLRSLTETTSQLQHILSDHTKRGDWGERRALDVLALAGFEKDKDFRCKTTSLDDDGRRIIPDFTFEFPNNILLHMDSKFPFDQYEKYITDNDEHSKQEHFKLFRDAVHSHVDKLNKYVSPGQNKVSFVILFIPFESLFRFIHERDSAIIDYALERKVVMCSPLTLYVLLRTIRQSVDAFAYSQASEEIRQAIEKMRHEWSKYREEFDKVDKELRSAQDAYDSAKGIRETKLMRTFSEIIHVTDKYRILPTETDV